MIVVTDFMRSELLKNGFDPNKIEIHPPVPRPGDPDLRSSFSDRNLIVYAGQIIRGKGVDVMLESLASGAEAAVGSTPSPKSLSSFHASQETAPRPHAADRLGPLSCLPCVP